MNLKEKIFNLLNEKNTEFISGQYLAEVFNVSRNAVWKAVNSLRKDGCNIYAVQNKGYTLDSGGIFTGEIIKSYMQLPVKIEYIETYSVSSSKKPKEFEILFWYMILYIATHYYVLKSIS